MKQIDPIRLLQERAAQDATHPSVALGTVTESASDYEIPLEPPAGARLQRLTIASTYRTPIPIYYDPISRTTYPTSSKG